ncbi:MAG TPA: isoprenylcysteine carboxylmethyltransferase family protein [Vicinamibacterales bacterium]|nr:isoprenylcysteine carboxylmethyltransferase family protein [Vicinamibacterales bacterium]
MSSLSSFSVRTLPFVWVAWGAIWWLIAARGAKTTAWRESIVSALAYRVPLIVAVIIIAGGLSWPAFLQRHLFAPTPDALVLAGGVMVVAGLGVTFWARWHLGRNWSSMVVVKQAHALVRTGPYRRVRHPIYSGLLLAFVGTMLIVNRWSGVVALPFFAGSLVWKLALEERRMRAAFPEYADWARHSAALVPFVW